MSDVQPQETDAQVLPEPVAGASSPVLPPEAPNTEALPTAEVANSDVPMADAPGAGDYASPAPAVQAPTSSRLASPAPARTGTPVRTNGVQDREPGSSRANSVHPEAKEPLPEQAAAHGDPVRRYLNTNVSGALLEGMKKLAKEQPADPLRVLGEFLLQRQRELDALGTA